MANVITDNFHQLTARISNGPIGPFCRWWFGELKEFLPQSWQQHLQHALRRMVIRLESDHLKMGVEENHSIQWIESLPLSQEAELQKQQVSNLIEVNDLKVSPRFLLLDETSVLRKELKLPAAAESNLQQVLTFEMDRQTPFRASEVYYTWKILSSEKESGQVRVELFVVPRKPVDAQLEILSQRGLTASGIDLLNEVDGPEKTHGFGVNLLPIEQRYRVANPRSRFNLGLAAAAFVLLVMVMMQSLSYRAGRLADLESAIAEVQGEARRVQNLREQVLETSEAASFLTRWRSQSPIAIAVLADVTTILPDDTFLDRLVIGQDAVLIQGKSANAQQLIEVVNNSEMFERAAFRGSTRTDQATGLEIFEVNTEISEKGTP